MGLKQRVVWGLLAGLMLVMAAAPAARAQRGLDQLHPNDAAWVQATVAEAERILRAAKDRGELREVQAEVEDDIAIQIGADPIMLAVINLRSRLIDELISAGSSPTRQVTAEQGGADSVLTRAMDFSTVEEMLEDTGISIPTVAAPGTEGHTISALTCGPRTLYVEETVTCSATINGEVTSTTWTAPNGSPASGSDATFTTSYTTTGVQTITLQACRDGACVNASTTVDVSRRPPAAETAPLINNLGCDPRTVAAGGTVTCSPALEGTTERTGYAWTAAGGAPASGGARMFSTSFADAGDRTIVLEVCNGEACTRLVAAISVEPAKPVIDQFGCTPAGPKPEEQVTCTVRATGTVTGQSWSATGGTPPSGSGATFATSFVTAGGKTIRVEVCNGTACVSREQAVTVMAASPKPPVTTTARLVLTEQDLGPCGYSVMPRTEGTVTLTVTFGADGKPATATASLSGGGGGSRTVTCNGTTGRVSWSVSYGGSGLTGMINPTTGAVTMNGTVTGRQSVSYSDCKDKDGKSISCPSVSQPPTWSYTTHLTATITAAGTSSGSSSVVMDSGCSTQGSW